MDEVLNIDRTKLPERYKTINEGDVDETATKATPGEIQFTTSYDNGAGHYDEDEDDTPVEPPREEQRPPRLSRPGKAAGMDKPAFEGGPLESQVLAWKKQFGRVYMTELEGEIFIWRTINRYEYKEVMNVPNTNELVREEMLCEVCVLFPYDYTYETMVNEAGGVPSLIAEQIMQKSGFTRRAKVTLL
jgi:hypothetical protein